MGDGVVSTPPAEGSRTTYDVNGVGDAALCKTFTHLARQCTTRDDFDRQCRRILRAIAYHENSVEMGELRKEARRIYYAVRPDRRTS